VLRVRVLTFLRVVVPMCVPVLASMVARQFGARGGA
jgi:hypothetical protein